MMPRGVKKENLPSKECVVCQRPFTWRKKWERCWDEVQTCSKSCNANRRSLKKASGSVTTEDDDESEGEGSAKVNSEQEDAGRSARDARKARKKAVKAEKRARRQGVASREVGQKQCDECGKSVDLLVRCQIDHTNKWNMVCGACWRFVSGGVVDGDENHPHYRYGGLWKNRNPQDPHGRESSEQDCNECEQKPEFR